MGLEAPEKGWEESALWDECLHGCTVFAAAQKGHEMLWQQQRDKKQSEVVLDVSGLICQRESRNSQGP